MNENSLPFGLREVVLFPLDATGARVAGGAVKLPVSRTFSFTESEDFETLEGDDRTAASHGSGGTVDWELEGGGVSLAVWKVVSGGTITESGTTGSGKRVYRKRATEQRPYFDVEGRAISDNGGDFHMVVYRCKADGDLEASMENGSFTLTSLKGTGFGADDATDDFLYDFVQNETATAIDQT